MEAGLENTVGRWLRKMDIFVAVSLLREKMQAHPDYPSLLSVTDTLDELGIDNAALQIEKERLHETPLPFLAHDAAHGDFVVIDNISKQVKAAPDFEKSWNGTALLGEKPEGWQHQENERAIKAEKRKERGWRIALTILILLSFLTLSQLFSFILAGLLASAFAGIGIAVLIVEYELGIVNPIGEKLCGTGRHNGCDAVMHSKGSHIGKWLSSITIGWADAGIVYFTAYSLLLVITMYTGGPLSILAILSAAALPFTLFSLYYQWRVVEKWCRLCLLTVAMLWMQAGITLLPAAAGTAKGFAVTTITFADALLAVFLITAVSAIWLLLLKPLLQNNKELQAEKFALLRFKNNPVVFEAVLNKQRQVDTTPFENELQLGNPDAPLQILVACNPYCGPCSQAHDKLHELVTSMDVGVTVRFTVKANDPEDKKTQAVLYMLQLLHYSNPAQKRNVLHDWFVLMNHAKFADEYPLPDSPADVTEMLAEYEQWAEDAGIRFTPTIFINGRELPKQYQVKDLNVVLRQLDIAGTGSRRTAIENNFTPA